MARDFLLLTLLLGCTQGVASSKPVVQDFEREIEGPNCGRGGLRALAGIDLNGNGVLDKAEISSARVICSDNELLAPSAAKLARGTYVSDEGKMRISIAAGAINDGNGIGTYEIVGNEMVAKIYSYSLSFEILRSNELKYLLGPPGNGVPVGTVFRRVE